MVRRWSGVILALCVAGAADRPLAQDPLKADAASMDHKLSVIASRGAESPGKVLPPLRTSFTEREVNAYFKVNGHDFLPSGIADPELKIDAGGRVSAKANVTVLLGAALPVTASGKLQTSNGMGVLSLDSATLGGVPVSASHVQQLIDAFSKPGSGGFRLDKPFQLPDNIRSVETQPGAATVVQ